MKLRYIIVICLSLVLAIVIAASTLLTQCSKGTEAAIEVSDSIDSTPLTAAELRAIGQWELLRISDEELVDTMRKGFFGDACLERIYYGTIRIGIDMADTNDGDIRLSGDTVHVSLPPLKVLDPDFIDEARTTTIFEKGKWDDATRKTLLQRARTKMMRRALSTSTMDAARAEAVANTAGILRAMGFPHSVVTVKKK